MRELSAVGPMVQMMSSVTGFQQAAVISAWLHRARRTFRRLRMVGRDSRWVRGGRDQRINLMHMAKRTKVRGENSTRLEAEAMSKYGTRCRCIGRRSVLRAKWMPMDALTDLCSRYQFFSNLHGWVSRSCTLYIGTYLPRYLPSRFVSSTSLFNITRSIIKP